MERPLHKGFKFPFYTDGMMYIFDKDGNLVLQTIKDLNKENMISLCDQLNGERNAIYQNEWEYRRSDQVVLQNGREMFSIRGWGYLTGIGGLNLPEFDATIIQDDLGEYIAERMRVNV